MSYLVDIFLQPDKAFAGLRERPAWLLPLLILLAFSAALPLFYFMSVDGAWYAQHMLASAGREMSSADAEKVKAMMPGRVVRVLVAKGDAVRKGAGLLILEAMKMENEIAAPADGTVDELFVEAGQTVESGAELLHIS